MPTGFIVEGRTLELVLLGACTQREADETLAAGLRACGTSRVRLLVEAQHATAPPTPDTLEANAASLAAVRPQLADHCVFVVPDEDWVHAVDGYKQRFESFGLKTRAFRDLEAANAWLDEVEPGR